MSCRRGGNSSRRNGPQWQFLSRNSTWGNRVIRSIFTEKENRVEKKKGYMMWIGSEIAGWRWRRGLCSSERPAMATAMADNGGPAGGLPGRKEMEETSSGGRWGSITCMPYRYLWRTGRLPGMHKADSLAVHDGLRGDTLWSSWEGAKLDLSVAKQLPMK
jgi:hypothetical protein